jgi:hypothetical protein
VESIEVSSRDQRPGPKEASLSVSIGVLCVRLCLSFVCNGARKRHAIVEGRRGGAKVRREGSRDLMPLRLEGPEQPFNFDSESEKSGVHNVVHQ